MSAVRRTLPQRVLKSRPVRDFALVTLGCIIVAYGLDAFLIPNRLAAGGVSGLATVAYYVLGSRGITLPIGIQMLLMNVVLLAFGIRAQGWRYGAKTLYGIVVLSVAVDVMALFVTPLAPRDNLLAVLYGGALSGLGLGFVFKGGGSTGGTDIVAQLLTRRFSLGIGQLLLVADAFVMAAAALAFGPTLALWGFLAVFVTGSVVDVVLAGPSVQKAAYIISARSEEVAGAILHELGRGATGLTGRGLFTGDSREVILTVVSRRELDDLKRLVKTVDPDAFLIISDVHEVLGLGFKEIGV